MLKTSACIKNPSLVYNGIGGTERKENFIGFPKAKSNPAGRGISSSVLYLNKAETKHRKTLSKWILIGNFN